MANDAHRRCLDPVSWDSALAGNNSRKGYWDWKLIDLINVNVSVQSDLKVGNDTKSSGGLCVQYN